MPDCKYTTDFLPHESYRNSEELELGRHFPSAAYLCYNHLRCVVEKLERWLPILSQSKASARG